jgi:ferredoxin
MLERPRPAQSPKGFFLPPAESVGRYGPSGAREGDAPPEAPRKVILLGLRACDLRARDYLDAVLLRGVFEDPGYARRRGALLLISVDCNDCTDTCFCTHVDGAPHAEEGFDLNLSPVNGGYVVETGSEQGRAWFEERVGSLPEADAAQRAERDRRRDAMTDRVRAQNGRYGFSVTAEKPPALPDDADEAWQHFAADCVECGACTHVCPTCHCFYLYDQVLGRDDFERVRTWDSCLFGTYHRMAGGPGTKISPRPRLSSRLANRVLHKFDYSPRQYEQLGCVGCGRCVEACLGEIDIRDVVEELAP